jgi:lysozyme family protein
VDPNQVTPLPADPEFERCLPITLKFEGGKVDDPSDPGGRTAFGITQRTFDRFCTEWRLPHRDVFSITPEEVHDIYAEDYWVPSGAVDCRWPMNLLIFDAAVNHGVSRAKRWAIKATGPMDFLAIREKFYADLILARPSSAKFRRGWMARVNALRAVVQP